MGYADAMHICVIAALPFGYLPLPSSSSSFDVDHALHPLILYTLVP
jgi:hypothetical protein